MIKNGTLLKDTKKFISKAPCMSFPLVGNLSDKEGFWTSQNDRKRTSGCLFTDEFLSKKTRGRNLQSAICNERGIALVMVLILSAIALAVMSGLIYMIIAGTQISGMQKRYKTALEAGMGGADVTYQLIGARGDPGISGIGLTITATSSCLTDKLNKSTANWGSGCDSSMTVGSSSNDMYFDLGASPYPTYRVYAKIVDTVEGNSAADEGLGGEGVTSSGSGEVIAVSMPYLYTIEVDAENKANPSERAKLSILYQY